MSRANTLVPGSQIDRLAQRQRVGHGRAQVTGAGMDYQHAQRPGAGGQRCGPAGRGVGQAVVDREHVGVERQWDDVTLQSEQLERHVSEHGEQPVLVDTVDQSDRFAAGPADVAAQQRVQVVAQQPLTDARHDLAGDDRSSSGNTVLGR